MNYFKRFCLLVFCSLLIQFSLGQRAAHHKTTTTTTVATTNKSPILPLNNRTRIIGGIETKRNEYPFIVSLFRGFPSVGHFCGGSIIDREWVLTAAHCVTKPDFKLTAGEHDLRSFEGTEQTVSAINVIRHPNYNQQTYEEDIALVKVSPPFNLTEHVKSFQLPSTHFVATGNAITSGWGVTAEGSNEVSPVLRKVTLQVFANMECSKMYGLDFHIHKMICAGDGQESKDACQGDSGGPLLCDDHRFGDTLCGVVSFGFGCGRPEFAGVYTKVAFYSEWVSSEVEKDSQSKESSGHNFTTRKSWRTTTTPTTASPIVTSNKRTKRPKDRNKSNAQTNMSSILHVIVPMLISLSINYRL